MSIYLAPSLVLSPEESASLRWPAFLWNNVLTIGGIEADSEEVSFPASNLANPQTTSIWKAATTAEQYLTFTLSGEGLVDSVGIARHNFGSAQIAVTIEGITADLGADWEVLAELVPGDDSPILAIFAAGFYVGLRLKLEPEDIAPQAAVVYVGRLLRMPRGIPPGHVPLFDARDVSMLTGVAENGDMLGDVITSEHLGSSVDFRLLNGDWYRANMRPFVEAREPFFFAWAPALYPHECSFAKFDGNPKPTISQVTGEMDISLQIIGLAL